MPMQNKERKSIQFEGMTGRGEFKALCTLSLSQIQSPCAAHMASAFPFACGPGPGLGPGSGLGPDSGPGIDPTPDTTSASIFSEGSAALYDPALPIHLFLSGPFSQWHASPFVHQGVAYATAEHFMMAEKARLFGDADTLRAILACKTPRDAQQLGKRVKGFDEARWDAHKVGIVRTGTLLKFLQNRDLLLALLQTGRAHLAEANPRDAVWGIKLSSSSPDARDVTKWRGQNLLGRILMSVREQVRSRVWTAFGYDWDALDAVCADIAAAHSLH